MVEMSRLRFIFLLIRTNGTDWTYTFLGDFGDFFLGELGVMGELDDLGELGELACCSVVLLLFCSAFSAVSSEITKWS